MTKDMKNMIKMNYAIYKIMIGNSTLSNGVNNIPINTGSNTVMNRIRNNTMNRLANKGQLGQLTIKNEKLKMTGKKNTPENLQGKNYPTVYHSSLFTNHFSLLSLNLFPLTINLYPSTLASLTLNLAPQTLNFGLCTSNNSITLYTEKKVNGTITENTTWQRGRHFIVTEDIAVPLNTSLLIEPGAVVRYNGYYKLKIEGNLLCKGEPENMIMFTPLDSKPRGITNIQRGKHLTGQASNQDHPAPGDWSRLELEGVDSTSTIEYARISFATNGILCKRASPRITKNCLKQSAEVGILIANESAPIIEHNLVFDASTGIRVEGGSQPKLSYNIIENEGKETLCGTGVVTNASSAKIGDNIILHCNKGLRTEHGGEPCLEYNLMADCEIGIDIYYCSGLDLNHNIVQYCRSITINITCSYPRIYNNNIIAKDQTLYLLATGGENPKPHDLIISNNYWGNATLEEIGRRIIDERSDKDGQKGEWRIVYEPIALEPFPDAGPR